MASLEENTSKIETPAESQPSPQNTASTNTVTDEEKFLSAMCYLPMGFILAMVTKPKSPFCKFHTKQGLALFLISIAAIIFLAILSLFMGSFLVIFYLLAYIVIAILGALHAIKGEMWPLPLIAQFLPRVDLDKIQAMADKIELPDLSIKKLPENKPPQPSSEPEKKPEEQNQNKTLSPK